MITHISHRYCGLSGLASLLGRADFKSALDGSSSVLVQIYTGQTGIASISQILEFLTLRLPRALVVGATSAGEIIDGAVVIRETVLGFTFFSSSVLAVMSHPCRDGEELELGRRIRSDIERHAHRVRAVMLLTTSLTTDTAVLLKGMESETEGIVFFGAAAAGYDAGSSEFVFHAETIYRNGVIAVLFCGPDLHVVSQFHCGWSPLGAAMKITSAQGCLAARVDGRPAFDVYQRMLGIHNDADFFTNALAFPFMVERDGRVLARTAVKAREDGGVVFAGDLVEGESFRIGFGDFNKIKSHMFSMHQFAKANAPDLIFLFSCCSRRFLMQQDVDLEIAPFQHIAPTFGFYTYGEYHGTKNLSVFNATVVAVMMREGPRHAETTAPSLSDSYFRQNKDYDPLVQRQILISARLANFIQNVTEDLERTRLELERLSLTDHLTGLGNRARLDRALATFFHLGVRYGTSFSVMLLDIDKFKSVNDRHGHLVGDLVLKQVAGLLAANTRAADALGRWGGEEFLIIIPNSVGSEAKAVAEKLRLKIERAQFEVVKKITCSFGIATLRQGDDVSALLQRADEALYAAKTKGRNCVVTDEKTL